MAKENKDKKLFSTFTFIGKPFINREEGKFYSSNTNDETGFVNSRVQFGIKSSENNLVFVELSGGYNKKNPYPIKTMDKDKNDLEIAWEDRFVPSIVDEVATWKSVRINLEDDKLDDCKKYLVTIGNSCYDAVEYLKEKLTDEKRLYVSGNVEITRYKNKQGQWNIGIKYIPTVIRLAKDDEENTAESRMSFIFDKESWDESGLKDADKKVIVTGYVASYDKTLGQTIFLPIPFKLNCSQLDFSISEHENIFNFYKDIFKAKRKEYYETAWHCYVLRGYEGKEITMEDLSKNQKMQIELGMRTFEQIKIDMRNSVVKNKINEIQLFAPINKFDNGEPSQLTIFEEDDFIIPAEEEKTENLNEVQIKDDDTGIKEIPEDDKSKLLQNLFKPKE